MICFAFVLASFIYSAPGAESASFIINKFSSAVNSSFLALFSFYFNNCLGALSTSLFCKYKVEYVQSALGALF